MPKIFGGAKVSSENTLRINAFCEECRERFEVNSQNLNKKEYNYLGKSIWITYYDCPHCGRRHMVQADDVKSKQMLVKVSIMFARLYNTKRKGKTISKKTSDKFKKARNDLSLYRNNLMKELNGKLATDIENGTTVLLRFSI